MEPTPIRMVAAACLVFALSACDRNTESAVSRAEAQAVEQKQQTPPPSASAGATAPTQVVPLPDFTPLMKNSGPAVVNVITTNKNAPRRAQGQAEEDPMLEFFRRFIPDMPPGGPGGPGGGPDGNRQRGGMGSGFIISPDGHILTNAHVVADFDDVTVKLADQKREFKAKVVGLDRRTDVALLKVDAQNLPTIPLGDSAKVEPGQWVAAIGSPFGFANTITAGIVSATSRALPQESFVPFIQTDVAVNPGNSGGPLINLKGEVVGINSMIYSRTGGYMGVSFAIPIEVALDVAKQLQATGKVTRGRLGVGIQPVTQELAKSFKLDSATGVVVVQVEKGSPAEKAGIRQGDVIVSFNGKKVEDSAELPRAVAATKPGEKATVEVWRNGKRERLNVTVGESPNESVAAAGAGKAPTKPAANALGLAVSELPPEGRKALGVDYGLVVEEVAPTGAAARSPLQRGDVIVAVGQDKFSSIEEFAKLVDKHKKGDSVALLVRRGEGALYVPLEVGTG
jgi:serine protease Do